MKLMVFAVLVAVLLLLGGQETDGRASSKMRTTYIRDLELKPGTLLSALIVYTKMYNPHMKVHDIYNIITSIATSMSSEEHNQDNVADFAIRKYNQRMGKGDVGIEDQAYFDALISFFDGPQFTELLEKVDDMDFPNERAMEDAILMAVSQFSVEELTNPEVVENIAAKLDRATNHS